MQYDYEGVKGNNYIVQAFVSWIWQERATVTKKQVTDENYIFCLFVYGW